MRDDPLDARTTGIVTEKQKTQHHNHKKVEEAEEALNDQRHPENARPCWILIGWKLRHLNSAKIPRRLFYTILPFLSNRLWGQTGADAFNRILYL